VLIVKTPNLLLKVTGYKDRSKRDDVIDSSMIFNLICILWDVARGRGSIDPGDQEAILRTAVPGLTCVRRPRIRNFSSIIQVVK